MCGRPLEAWRKQTEKQPGLRPVMIFLCTSLSALFVSVSKIGVCLTLCMAENSYYKLGIISVYLIAKLSRILISKLHVIQKHCPVI